MSDEAIFRAFRTNTLDQFAKLFADPYFRTLPRDKAYDSIK